RSDSSEWRSAVKRLRSNSRVTDSRCVGLRRSVCCRHPTTDRIATLDEYDLLHTMIGAGRRLEDVRPAADTGDYLVILEGTDLGKCVEIGEEPLTIGRDARQTIVFAADSEVSRLHARVLRRDNEIVAEDAGSTNGTFVRSE